MFSGERGEVDFFGGDSHPMPALLPCHRVSIDRCMINIHLIDARITKASDHDMLDHAYFTPELKQTCYDERF